MTGLIKVRLDLPDRSAPRIRADERKSAPPPVGSAIDSAEDQVRADFYALLARLFYAAPDDKLLQAIVIAPEPASEGNDALLVESWRALAAAAGAVNEEALAEEYQQLFIGVGRPDVMLFGSYYLAGFMNEKPLAQLRDDLAALGLARNENASESEDHLAALCDVLRFLISGDRETPPAAIEQQKAFFSKHMQPWVLQFCQAVMQSDKANFYKRAAAFAGAFFTIEIEAFDIE
jgi:TorA maturation chaperone TorD